MNDEAIEQEIQSKGLTAPRITPDHIESVIVSEYYFTGADGLASRYLLSQEGLTDNPNQPPVEVDIEILGLLTFCVLVLTNGFSVTGESACASPENFDAEIGRKIARQKAVEKIWLLEGYMLREHLHQQEAPE